MKTYTDGQIAVITSTFTVPDSTGQPVNADPTTVTFKYAIAPPSSALGNTTTITYSGASIPALGEIARVAQGVYVTELDTTGQPGSWTFELVSTGICQTVSDPPGVFTVQPRAL